MTLSYIDKAAMVSAFGEPEIIQLTDRARTGAIDDSVLDRVMGVAESEVNSYVGAAYELPLEVVPETLKSFACDIARYYLYETEPTDAVTNRYERAVSWLRDVSRGVVSLGLKAEEAPESVVVVVSSREQVFSPSALSKMGPKW